MSIKDLSQPDVFTWLKLALINWTQIILIFFLISLVGHPLLHLLGIFLLGTRLHALALLGHEAIHRNISQARFWNNFWGSLLSSLPLFQTLNLFKKFHLDHHAHLQSSKDPEISFRSQTPQRWSLPLTPVKRLKLFLTDLSGIGYLESRHVLWMTFKNLQLLDLLLPLIFWILVTTAFVLLDAGWIPLYWTIAFVTSYWAMFRQRALVEHLGTEETQKIHANLLQRFLYLPHNTWYHYEHHRYPQVPCWNLPKTRATGERVMSVTQLLKRLAETKESISGSVD